MPQMFPMPFILLMIMVMIFFLISMIRVYWHLLDTSLLSEGEGSGLTKSLSNFSQSW